MASAAQVAAMVGQVVAGCSQVWPGDARRWLELARAAYVQGVAVAARGEIRASYPVQKVRSWRGIFAISYF